MQKPDFICILFSVFIAVIFFTSCQERYWYRVKIPVLWHSQPLRKIHLTVNNNSPVYLSNQFKNNIRAFYLKKLSNFGFEETKKDTPEFNFEVELQVDSFHTSGVYKFNKQYYNYKNFVLQLSISYLITNPKKGIKVWENKNEQYFFEVESKDFRRSKSMIRYSFRQMPEEITKF